MHRVGLQGRPPPTPHGTICPSRCFMRGIVVARGPKLNTRHHKRSADAAPGPGMNVLRKAEAAGPGGSNQGWSGDERLSFALTAGQLGSWELDLATRKLV